MLSQYDPRFSHERDEARSRPLPYRSARADPAEYHRLPGAMRERKAGFGER